MFYLLNVVGGFGSCLSFGVAVDLRGYGMCQMGGNFRRRIFLKMRRVGHFIYHLSHVLFFKVQVVSKSFSCHCGKSSLVMCHSLGEFFVRPHCHQRFAGLRSGGVRSTSLSPSTKFICCTKVSLLTVPAILQARCYRLGYCPVAPPTVNAI